MKPRTTIDLLAALPPASLAKFVHSLTRAEFGRLWERVLADGESGPLPTEPRARLAEITRRERMVSFWSWFGSVGVVRAGEIYLRLAAGADPIALMEEYNNRVHQYDP